jgi:hypothetical protein
MMHPTIQIVSFPHYVWWCSRYRCFPCFANSLLSARLLLFSDIFSPSVAIHMTPVFTGITKLSFPHIAWISTLKIFIFDFLYGLVFITSISEGIVTSNQYLSFIFCAFNYNARVIYQNISLLAPLGTLVLLQLLVCTLTWVLLLLLLLLVLLLSSSPPSPPPSLAK